jgi:hypothetical protein
MVGNVFKRVDQLRRCNACPGYNFIHCGAVLNVLLYEHRVIQRQDAALNSVNCPDFRFAVRRHLSLLHCSAGSCNCAANCFVHLVTNFSFIYRSNH